jgi:type II secretory pathway pseudopilin PulG
MTPEQYRPQRSDSTMPTQRPPQATFTLIELIFVIAMVGLLTGLAVPVIGKVCESGDQQTINKESSAGSVFWKGC